MRLRLVIFLIEKMNEGDFQEITMRESNLFRGISDFFCQKFPWDLKDSLPRVLKDILLGLIQFRLRLGICLIGKTNEGNSQEILLRESDLFCQSQIISCQNFP